MSAEQANKNPIGIEDPDGQVWPFNHPFSPQMQNAGCKPIYSKASYAKKLKAQVRKSMSEKDKSQDELGIHEELFGSSGESTERDPVDVNAAQQEVGVRKQ